MAASGEGPFVALRWSANGQEVKQEVDVLVLFLIGSLFAWLVFDAVARSLLRVRKKRELPLGRADSRTGAHWGEPAATAIDRRSHR
jgi:hypothetical protein